MKHIVMGILAHVDAGKTTLSESILYTSGAVRKIGRVDHGDTFFDTDNIERERGITIFSKQTRFVYQQGEDDKNGIEVTLLDTPGHVDFSAETERVLSVLDYAVLVISGLNGVQSHTRTLWRLLRHYNVPTFIFVNKMDVARISREELMEDIRENISPECVDMEPLLDNGNDAGDDSNTPADIENVLEEIATVDEAILDEYMETGSIAEESIARVISEEKLFPVYFGSALKMDGITNLLDAISLYALEPTYSDEFSARVFKVLRDKNNKRLTFLKVLGGTLKLKDSVLPYGAYPEAAMKVNEIRQVTGEKYEPMQELRAGHIAAVTGLDESYPGQGLGDVEDAALPSLVPVLTYTVLLGEDADAHNIFEDIKILADEDPMLMPTWEEKKGIVGVSLMGKVQLEVIKRKIKERFDEDIDFGTGTIVYKETIAESVEGHGHFEPLRHYADVRLRLEPLPPGSGIEVVTECSTDVLERQHQNQIMRQCYRANAGVLTGANITDIRMVITGGKSHKKHTEGGDFRKATKIAIRDALLRTENVLLEPYYHVTLDVPSEFAGRAMTDISNMNGKLETPIVLNDRSIIEGIVPVSLAMDYASQVQRYTGGLGEIRIELAGYYPCHNSEEIIEEVGYDFRSDARNPYESIYVHQENPIDPIPGVNDNKDKDETAGASAGAAQMSASPKKKDKQQSLDDELDNIFRQTYGEKKDKPNPNPKRTILGEDEEKRRLAREKYYEEHPNEVRKKEAKQVKIKKKYLLVDGYNVIFAWKELKELAADNLDAARGRLIDILCNYQGYSGVELIAVFDAYKVKGGTGSNEKYNNIYVVYTKEAQTADAYIERTTHEIFKREEASISVVSSDGLVQMIVAGDGAIRISAREFEKMVSEAGAEEGF